jgi:hypothetical protein
MAMAKVRARDKSDKIRGGIIIFLPLLLLASTDLEFSITGTATDNLYFLNQKEPGSILNFNGLLFHESFIGLEYNGNFSSVNFSSSNLVLENSLVLNKTLYLPGVGNRNEFFLNLYSFLPKEYEIYRLFEIGAGDSLNYYLLSQYGSNLSAELFYRNFHSDSIEDYLEPAIKSSISIPMPFFFLKPGFTTGFKIYDNENLFFFEPSVGLEFPLNFNFSFDLFLSYYKLTMPKTSFLVPASYFDDIMFEPENINDKKLIGSSFNLVFTRTPININLGLTGFEKNYFALDDATRKDQGVDFNFKFTKKINQHFVLNLQYDFLYNHSNLEDFQYLKNTGGLTIGLIF